MPARLHIPLEILSSILDHLPFKALLSLRTISKTFLHQINPRIFSEVTIRLHEIYCDENSLKLIKLISTSPIGSSIFNTIGKVTLDTWRDFWEDKTNFLIDDKTPKAFLSDHLVPFLRRLPNLHTLDWTHYVGRKPSLYFAHIAQTLSRLAKLQNVAIKIHRCDWYQTFRGDYKLPPLHIFKNLSSLSVSYTDDIPQEYYDREIATVIAASPKLTRFDLGNRVQTIDDPSITETCTSLQTLFGNARSPQLTHLELGHIPLSSAGLNQKLSQKLKSLTISTPIGSRRLKFAWAELFTTLEEIGVELSHLSVTGMEAAMDEMFSYLTSYGSVLQTLEIRKILMDCQEQEDKAGHRFWDQVVLHHKGSIKVLCVYPVYEGEWCYGQAAASAISQCSSLRNLTIANHTIGSAWANAKLSPESIKTVIKCLNVREPWSHPDNSAASILTDVPSSLAQLTLIGSLEAGTREDTINDLNRGIRRKRNALQFTIEDFP
ncbi:hypothetical protein MMC31_007347 [Peltigera leucophlebia]|nr:hypothetical protein [Peltigera leucophlebia]